MLKWQHNVKREENSILKAATARNYKFALYRPILTPAGAGSHEEQAGRNLQECAFFYTAQLRDEHKVPHKTKELELLRRILQKMFKLYPLIFL